MRYISKIFFFGFVLFEGFKEGVLPGVFLLSRCLLSGIPVESAVLFVPGLILISFIIKIYYKFRKQKNF